MKERELGRAVATIRRLLMSEGSELVHDGTLRTVLRELELLGKGGKLERKRVVRIVAIVSEIACEVLVKKSGKNA